MDFILQSPVLMAVFLVITTIIVITILMRTTQEKTQYKLPNAMTQPVDSSLNYEECVRLGNEAAGKYEFDKALAHFQEALKLKKKDPSIHFKMGRLFIQKTDYKNAIIAFRNVLSLNPNQIEAHFELARIYQLQGEHEHAQHALTQVLNLEADHEEALRLKVKLAAQTEQYQQALPVLKKLIEISHHPMKYRSQRAEFLTKLKRLDEAIDEYDMLLEQDPENQIFYKSKIGQVYFEKGNYTKAIEYFKVVLQEQDLVGAGETLGSIRSQMAAALCNEGVKLFEADDCANAIQRYQEALLYDSSNVDIHYNLGKAYVRVQNPLNAIKHFEVGIAINAADISCHYELAVLQDEKGMIKEAISSYEKVLELEPKNLKSLFGLGTLFGVQGDLDQSIHFLSEAIRLDPKYVDAVYNLGVALEHKKDFNKATQVYKRVLKLDKNHEKARSNLAHIQHVKMRTKQPR